MATGTLVAVVGVLGLATSPGAAPPTDDPALGAAYGARWLAAQVDPAGYVPGPDDNPSASATLNTALALAAAAVEPATFDAMVSWLEANVETVIPDLGADSPGRLGLLLLIADAAGEPATDFGGADLPARLAATLGDFTPGLYGAADPTYDGVYRQSLALLGLRSAGITPPVVAIDWLVAQQCSTGAASALGGWMAYRADTAVGCPAPDSSTFSGPDSNQTALALAALAALDRSPSTDPEGFLRSAQDPDGGFSYYPGQDSDPNSTALVISALLADGASLGDWQVDGTGPLDALLAWQIGCEAPADERGAFASPYSDGFPDAFATVQAVPGAAGAVYPLGEVDFAGPAPVPCQPTPTSTTSTTAAPTTTVSYVPVTAPTTFPARPASVAAATPQFTG